VRTALSHTSITRCYRTALRTPAGAPTSATSVPLDITFDMGGRIVAASLRAPTLPTALRQCVEDAARSTYVRGVDTGDGSATVTLTFSPGG
jgi:hypothetical protein